MRSLHVNVAAFAPMTTANHDAKYPFPTSVKGPRKVATQAVPVGMLCVRYRSCFIKRNKNRYLPNQRQASMVIMKASLPPDFVDVQVHIFRMQIKLEMITVKPPMLMHK